MMLNHLVPDAEQKQIDRLWQAHGMKGAPPKSYHQKLKRLEAAGVDVSSLTPPGWGKPIPDWQKAIICGEGMEEAHRDWKNERISESLLKADMAAGADGAAKAKTAKNKKIIEAYKKSHGMTEAQIPLAKEIAAEIAKRDCLTGQEERNLTRRLRRTELAT